MGIMVDSLLCMYLKDPKLLKLWESMVYSLLWVLQAWYVWFCAISQARACSEAYFEFLRFGD